MDTTKLIQEMAAQKAAMNKYNVDRRQAEAAARWRALGGQPEGLARVDAGHFMSMTENEQRRLIAALEVSE